MNKKVLIAMGMGLALTLGAVQKSEAFWFWGGSSDDDTANVIGSDVENSNITAGDGNTSASNLRNSTVVGGNMSSSGSNSIGSIGINKGDISQSNSQSVTSGTTNLVGNDMKDMSNRGSR
jgi:hypothetical protein